MLLAIGFAAHLQALEIERLRLLIFALLGKVRGEVVGGRGGERMTVAQALAEDGERAAEQRLGFGEAIEPSVPATSGCSGPLVFSSIARA
jgi:hypothetical protein